MSYSRRMLGSKRCDIGKSRSEIGFHQLAQRVAEFRVLQTEREVGFEIAELFAAIVTPRRCPQPMKGLAVADQFCRDRRSAGSRHRRRLWLRRDGGRSPAG